MTRERDELVERHRGLFSRAVLVSVLTLLSRIVGFAREVLSAALFGDRSPIFDAFITAWRVPNLFRRFLGEGALSTSLQTELTRADAAAGDAGGRAVFLATSRATLWILIAVCGLVMLAVAFLPDTMPVTGWSWLGEDPGPVRELTVRVMPFVVLICLSALSMGALHVRGHFATPALAPVVMNFAWVGTLLVVGTRFGWPLGEEEVASPERQLEMARVLAWGVLLAGALQLLVQVPALVRRGLLGGRSEAPEGFEDPRATVWNVLRRSAPLALGAAVYQINVMVDGLMAEELLTNGGPTAHYYANRVQQFPMALISVAATSSVFPALQALGVRRRLGEMRVVLDRTMLGIGFLALPASAGLFVLAEPLASVLFQRGGYGPEGVARIAAALRMLALAVLPAGLAGLAGRAYYALGDFHTPVRISIAMLVLNVGLNLALVLGAGMDVEGLALATAVTSWGNWLLLLPGLADRLEDAPGVPITGRLVRMAAAAVASGASALAAHGSVAARAATGDRSVLALVAGIGAGMVGYALAARVLRCWEWPRGRSEPRRGGPPAE